MVTPFLPTVPTLEEVFQLLIIMGGSGCTEDQANNSRVGVIDAALKLSGSETDDLALTYLDSFSVLPNHEGRRPLQNVEHLFYVMVGVKCGGEALDRFQLEVYHCEGCRTKGRGKWFPYAIQGPWTISDLDLIESQMIHKFVNNYLP